MSRKSLFISFVVFTMGLLHTAAPLISQTKPPNRVLRPFTDLSLEIVASSTTYLKLQPIPFIINLRNPTPDHALGYSSLEFGGYPISVFVQRVGDPNRTKIRKLTPISGLTGVIHSVIPPRETVVGKDWITLNLNEYFPTTGNYQIQTRLFNRDGTQSIDSNIVVIEIQEPTGINRMARDLIQLSTFQDSIFSGSEFSEARGTLERLTTLYPSTVYGQSASFVLGENYFYARNYPQALINLVRLENDSNFIHAEKVRKYLAEIRRINSLQPGNEKPEPQKPQ